MDRLAPLRRPAQRPQGSQRWHRLLFLHWEVPESALRPLVPARLGLDSYQGRFFVGLVAFTMQHVRPYAWAPPFPTARTFYEINVRTYVHVDGEEPGVYFFSLEASSTLAVGAARALWSLPYFRTRFRHADDGRQVRWRAERRWPGPRAAPFEAEYEVGDPLPASAPDSLPFFLCERYQLYAARGGKLLRGRVHHSPYPLQEARVERVEPTLVTAAGLPTDGARTEDYFSPGVDVQIYPLETVG